MLVQKDSLMAQKVHSGLLFLSLKLTGRDHAKQAFWLKCFISFQRDDVGGHAKTVLYSFYIDKMFMGRQTRVWRQ